MRSYINLLIYSFAILQFFQFHSVNGHRINSADIQPMDKTADGKISEREFYLRAKQLFGNEYSNDTISLEFQNYDLDNDGQLTVPEMNSAMKRMYPSVFQ